MAISRYSCATASTAKRYSSGTSCGPPASCKYPAFLACIASANRGVFRNCAAMALLMSLSNKKGAQAAESSGTVP